MFLSRMHFITEFIQSPLVLNDLKKTAQEKSLPLLCDSSNDYFWKRILNKGSKDGNC